MKKLLALVGVLTLAGIGSAQAANEYLQNIPQGCNWGSFEPYVEYGREDGSTNHTGDRRQDDFTNDRNSGRIGFRFNIPLHSTCTDEYRMMVLETYKLTRELELLKKCQRYKNLELGPNFATVDKLCKGIKMKDGTKSESTSERRKRERNNDPRTVDEINADRKKILDEQRKNNPVKVDEPPKP